jgi:hypothetical protein
MTGGLPAGGASAWNVGRTWLESMGAFRGRRSIANMLLRPLFRACHCACYCPGGRFRGWWDAHQ